MTDHRSQHSSPPQRGAARGICLFALLLVALWTPGAQAEDRVLVVFVGPNDGAPVYGLFDDAEQARALQVSERVLLQGVSGATTFSDIRVLPSGGSLLADAGQRGFVVTDRDGIALATMGAPGSIPSIESAAVVSYADDRIPARVLLSDNSTGRAQIYDLIEKRYVWHQPFTLMSFRGLLATAIWMPGDRAAIAVNWPSLGIYAIDVLLTRTGEDWRPLRYTNVAHNEGPIDQIVVEEFGPLRDLMAFDDGSLLVTSQYRLMAIAANGEVLWQVDAGETPELGGEFVSARLLTSGHVALATREPGYWTYPHTNHRIHWFSLNDGKPQWRARTPPLDAAPSRIEAALGQGATGSFAFFADLDGERGSIDDLRVLDGLTFDASSYRVGQVAEFTATLKNEGPTAVRLDRLYVAVAPDLSGGDCLEIEDGGRVDLWQRIPLLVEANGFFILRSSRALEQPISPGDWCGRLLSIDDQNIERIHGPPTPLRIIGATGTSTVIVRDLDDVGSGGDDDEIEEPDLSFDEVATGCGCATLDTSPPAAPIIPVAIVLGLWLQNQRRCR